mmetsp:Transcript_22756/g.50588  ORF Transcript_22756/g.50588 Transcript_22756/m.50588 type:complete len:440 (-) Transcript_22756:1032-2351(-)
MPPVMPPLISSPRVAITRLKCWDDMASICSGTTRVGRTPVVAVGVVTLRLVVAGQINITGSSSSRDNMRTTNRASRDNMMLLLLLLPPRLLLLPVLLLELLSRIFPQSIDRMAISTTPTAASGRLIPTDHMPSMRSSTTRLNELSSLSSLSVWISRMATRTTIPRPSGNGQLHSKGNLSSRSSSSRSRSRSRVMLHLYLLLLRLRSSSSSRNSRNSSSRPSTSNKIRSIISHSKAISSLYSSNMSSSTRDTATKQGEGADRHRQEDRLCNTRGLLRRGAKGRRHHLIREEDQVQDQDQDHRCRHPSVPLRTGSTALGLAPVQVPEVLPVILVSATIEEARHRWANHQEVEWEEAEEEARRLLLLADHQEDQQDHQEAAEAPQAIDETTPPPPSSFPTYPETFVLRTCIGMYRPSGPRRNHSHQRSVRHGARSTKREGQG